MNNRSQILLQALQLFADRGYDAVGVQSIAVQAGITKPTLYHYFGSKSKLLEEVIGEYGKPLCTMISEASNYQGDLSLTLLRVARVYFQFAKENQEFYRMQLAIYFAPPDSEPNRVIRIINEKQFHVIEGVFIQAAADHSELANHHQALAAIFIGTINTYIGFALNGYIDFKEEPLNQVVHQFVYGIYN